MFDRLKKIILADYYAQKAATQALVAQRFSRGNVVAQMGRLLSRDQLDAQSQKADKALINLEK